MTLFLLLSVFALCAAATDQIRPDFLQFASNDAIQQFYAIVNDATSSNNQREQQIDQLVSTLDQNSQNAYNQLKQKMQQEKLNFESQLQQKISKLSPQAQSAIVHMQQMNDVDNQMLSINEKVDRIDQYISTLPLSVQQELKTLEKQDTFGEEGSSGPVGYKGPHYPNMVPAIGHLDFRPPTQGHN